MEGHGGQYSPQAIWGFDGYIDTLYQVASPRQNPDDDAYYQSKAAFARAIGSGEKSADLELRRKDRRMGGNAPIAALAMARLGVDTCCVGAMGEAELHPLFQVEEAMLRCISLADPADTIALEFGDSKLMMADAGPLHTLCWEGLLLQRSQESWQALFGGAALIGLVNWGVSPGMGRLWRDLRAQVLQAQRPAGQKLFVDLADPARRSREELQDCLRLLESYASGYEVTLGLNLNEAEHVCAALGISTQGSNARGIEAQTQAIFRRMAVARVVVHHASICACAGREGCVAYRPVPAARIRLLTGAGDTFNAGYCYGWMQGLPPLQCLEWGGEVSRRYIEQGESPRLESMRL